MTIISGYASIITSNEEMILEFYENLRTILMKIPVTDKIFLLGDIIASVDQDDNTCFFFLGKHGLGKIIPKLESFWKSRTKHTRCTWVYLRKIEQCYFSHLKMLGYHYTSQNAKPVVSRFV